MITFFQAIWAMISPSYRKKVYRRYGWVMCMNAVGHLLMDKSRNADMGDVEAARILNQKMRELNW